MTTKHRISLSFLLLLAVSTAHGGPDDLYNWRCPYTPDGACAPRRGTYGHYPTKWLRWPGVTDADYESRIKSGELSAPPGPRETPPREGPEDFMPSSGPTRGDDTGAPPLTREDESPPDNILSQPGEDVMEEFIPDEETKQPEPEPTPEPSLEPSPEPSSEPTPDPDKPFDDDPFKDDPLFNDDAPAPPTDTKRSGIHAVPQAESPAMRTVPRRLRAAQQDRTQSPPRLSRSARSGEARLMPSAPRSGRLSVRAVYSGRDRVSPGPGLSRNPLRSGPAPETVAVDEEVVPTAAWQEPQLAEPKREAGWHANPLRSQ
jgi:hypothetical protein